MSKRMLNPWEIVTTVGGAVGTIVSSTSDLGEKIKDQAFSEIEDLSYERNIANALSRIEAKAKAIKKIMRLLSISATEAEELLQKELDAKQRTATE